MYTCMYIMCMYVDVAISCTLYMCIYLGIGGYNCSGDSERAQGNLLSLQL